MRRIGTKELQTNRLYLRKLKAEDAQMMYDNWANDAEVTKFLTWTPHNNAQVTAQLLAMWEAEYTDPARYHWGIQHKESGQLIGTIGVVSRQEHIESAIIGYCLSRKYWNQGLMTEAVKAVNGFLLKEAGFNRVEAYHHVDNPASGRVMAKSGMTYEGVRRDGSKHGAYYCDVAVYAILKKDL